MTVYGSVPDFVVSASISVAFGTVSAVKFIISAVSGVVSESTASTEWSGELGLDDSGFKFRLDRKSVIYIRNVFLQDIPAYGPKFSRSPKRPRGILDH
ncbi:hypothetical protein AVEN_263708-1 [Araneus ventricosus]|uniref:Uncharacterized protein n=1 Tax=Araneus ventricosus TaxID=182803 RepID=A0A4Y2ARP0_ARAVE|nr:hypothetical protein AVEN_263708-1 [Araneus ventricosus]